MVPWLQLEKTWVTIARFCKQFVVLNDSFVWVCFAYCDHNLTNCIVDALLHDHGV